MTIWACLTGHGTESVMGDDGGVPYDADDFGRCHRLLERLPEWRDRLPEVAAVVPAWAPLVVAWNELTRLYTTNERRMLDVRLREVVQKARA